MIAGRVFNPIFFIYLFIYLFISDNSLGKRLQTML